MTSARHVRHSRLRLFLLITLFSALLLPACERQPKKEPEVGDPAPNFTLPNALGGTVTLAAYKNEQPVLLYFHMAVGWSLCMKQVVDLQNDSNFQSLNVAVLSIAADSIDELSAESQKIGITEIPMLSDTDKKVAASYGVLKWAVPSGEPGHTFVLVNQDGTLAWIQDYGAPDNPNRTMYVPIDELIQAIETHLKP